MAWRCLAAACLAGFLAASGAGRVEAACVCRCVDGKMQPVCTSAVEHRPLCPPTVCPLDPPTLGPVTPPVVPPVGARGCAQRQVLNPDTNRYEWREVCE